MSAVADDSGTASNESKESARLAMEAEDALNAKTESIGIKDNKLMYTWDCPFLVLLYLTSLFLSSGL